MRRSMLALLCLVLISSVGCVGVRMTDTDASVHAESFRIVGFAIPCDDQEAARKLWAEKCGDYAVTTTYSTPADWHSIVGFFGNLFGFHKTHISGSK